MARLAGWLRPVSWVRTTRARRGNCWRKCFPIKMAVSLRASCKALALRGDRANLKVIESLLEDSRDIVEATGAAAVLRLEVSAKAHPRTAPKR